MVNQSNLTYSGNQKNALKHTATADQGVADAEAHYSNANILKTQGRLNEAVGCYQKAIQLRPDFVEAYYNLSNTLLTNNDINAAIKTYKKTIRLCPQHAGAFNNLGVALKAGGNNAEAIKNYEQAIELKPDFAEAYNNLANAFLVQGRHDDAIEIFEIVIRLKSNYADAYYNLGLLYSETNRAAESIACYQRLLQIQPDNSEALNNLGNIFYRQSKFNEAISAYQKAFQLNPNYAEAYYNMANALLEQDKLKKALSFYQKALALRPDWAELHNNMGTAFQNQGKLNDAISHFQKALENQPDYAEAMNNLGIAYRNQGRFRAAIQCYQAALQINPAYREAHSNLLFCLNYDPAVGQKDIFTEACNWWHQHGLPNASAFVHRTNDDPQRRLKIGYVSPDLRRHSVGFFFLPLIAAHHHAEFEIYCYAEVKQPDETTKQIRTHADHWFSTVGQTDMAVAEKVHSDQIDILVDLAGHTANNRLGVFAARPAPIQVTWLGYPNTTGLTTIDYRLTDNIADPAEAADHLYSETLVRLPQGFLCYGPPEDAPDISGLPATETGRITFGSFNALPKMNAAVIAVWSEIMRQVPASHLLLKCKQLADAPTLQTYLDVFARHGIGADRIRMLAHTPSFREHLAWYNNVDIGLDPFPYNGTTTTCEALWMGVPVVTLRGERHSARVGASILSNIGLTDLIAETEEQYAIKAIKLATNMERLQKLRSEMRDRITSSPINDAQRFASDVEITFRDIWRKWCKLSGEESETFRCRANHHSINF